MGVPWRSPGVIGAPLGNSWSPLGSPLRVLESRYHEKKQWLFIVFPGIEAPLRNTWEVVGGSCDLLGGPSGTSKKVTRTVLVPLLGHPQGFLGRPWGTLAVLGFLWESLGLFGCPYSCLWVSGGCVRQSKSSAFPAAPRAQPIKRIRHDLPVLGFFFIRWLVRGLYTLDPQRVGGS